ncbi:MAG: general secretion pathway protein GspB [Thermodesulfovibrionia bacterium]|nr:general secretion pathway protein GspB [Thermodesulfovibrionia bacterium]
MSFILDGLKKLEENRNRDAVPNLLTVHTPEFQKTKKRPVWPYFIFAVLVLNAFLISIWLGIWAPEEKVSVKQTELIKEETAVNLKQLVPEVTTANEARTQKQDLIIKENTAVKDKESIKTTTAAVHKNNEDKKQIDIEKASSESFSLIEQEDTAENKSQSEPSDKIFELSELPLNIRQGLPVISISAHIYSNNPSSRLVNINGSIIHEGDNVTPELGVDEITMNGVILKYRGYRFSMRGL